MILNLILQNNNNKVFSNFKNGLPISINLNLIKLIYNLYVKVWKLVSHLHFCKVFLDVYLLKCVKPINNSLEIKSNLSARMVYPITKQTVIILKWVILTPQLTNEKGTLYNYEENLNIIHKNLYQINNVTNIIFGLFINIYLQYSYVINKFVSLYHLFFKIHKVYILDIIKISHKKIY